MISGADSHRDEMAHAARLKFVMMIHRKELQSMNWRLVFTLSILGAAMGFATMLGIPTDTEACLWLGIFLFCAYLIAKHNIEDHFIHGFAVSVLNGTWIGIIHLVLIALYHPAHRDLFMLCQQRMEPFSPHSAVLFFGTALGAGAGIISGFFAFLAGKLRTRRPRMQLRSSH